MTISVDERIHFELAALSQAEGISASEFATRLLRRAVRARRPRPGYDTEMLRAAAAVFAEEDIALAESDTAHRAQLLDDEDNAI